MQIISKRSAARLVLAAHLAMTSLWAGVAQATPIDLIGDFGTAQYSYGMIGTDGSVTPFLTNSPAGWCPDNTGNVDCYQGAFYYQLVAATGSSVAIHPGPPLESNAAIIFTALIPDFYSLDITVYHADSGGDGGHLSYYLSSNPGVFTSLGSTTGTFGSAVHVDLNFHLDAGEIFALILDSKTGDYFNDSHSFKVPEPSTWMMLVAGLSLIGFNLRSRRPR